MLPRTFRFRAVSDLTGRVLEVGAGAGPNFPYYLAARRVVAVEPDREKRETAERYARSMPLPIQVIDARAELLPFAQRSFDAAVFTLVLCSVDDIELSLAEVRRVVRPGGTVRFVEHLRAPDPWVASLQTWATPFWRRIAGNCHLDRRTVEALQGAGFEIDRCRAHYGGVLVEVDARTLR